MLFVTDVPSLYIRISPWSHVNGVEVKLHVFLSLGVELSASSSCRFVPKGTISCMQWIRV
jgi:hypothetical protein